MRHQLLIRIRLVLAPAIHRLSVGNPAANTERSPSGIIGHGVAVLHAIAGQRELLNDALQHVHAKASLATDHDLPAYLENRRENKLDDVPAGLLREFVRTLERHLGVCPCVGGTERRGGIMKVRPVSCFLFGLLFTSRVFGYTGCSGDTNIVAEYIFHEGGGNTAYNTGTDNGAGDATLTNGVTFSTDVPPANTNCGYSVSLPATGSGSTTPALETATSYDPLAGATNFTIMAWVKRQSATSNDNTSARVVSDESSTSQSANSGLTFRFVGTEGQLALRINNNEVQSYIVNGLIRPNDGNWHHVAMVYDGTRPATNALTRNVHFYLDGIQRGDGHTLQNAVVGSNSNKITIGNSSVSRTIGNVLVGKIDDVRVLRGFTPAAVGDGNANATILCYINNKDDFEPPTIVCPTNVVVITPDNNGLCVAGLPDLTGTVSLSDNCAIAGISQTPEPSTFVGSGVTTVALTATDISGHSATCTRTVRLDCDCDVLICGSFDGSGERHRVAFVGTGQGSGSTSSIRPFANISIKQETNQWMTITWESSPTNRYIVLSADDLTTNTTWAQQTYVWGQTNATTTSWTDTTTANVPRRFYKVQRIVASPIAAGDLHSLALTPDGKLWAWGNNGLGEPGGELGDGLGGGDGGVEPYRSYPGEVAAVVSCTGLWITNAVTVSGDGDDCSVVADAQGTVWTFGETDYGGLGNGTNTSDAQPVPLPIAGVSNVVSVAAGVHHTLALCADGKVFAWGEDAFSNEEEPGSGTLGAGTLPIGYTAYSPIQSLVPTGVVIVAIAAGADHNLAVDLDGRVYAWGANSVGQLGNGGTGFTNVPILLTTISNVIAIAAGSDHSVALTLLIPA
jgi:hypothetical protein